MSAVSDRKLRLEEIQRDWNGCERCDLCSTRTQVVHYRGYTKVDFLFVGEGPGTTEDVKGLPFVGPAGHLLDMMIADAFERVVPIGWDIERVLPHPVEIVQARTKTWPRTGFGNLVACIPVSNGRIVAPPKFAVDACQPRLRGILDIVQPRVVVRCGAQARIGLPDKLLNSLEQPPERIANVTHPAALLRQPNMDKDYKATVNELVMLAREIGFGEPMIPKAGNRNGGADYPG